MTSILFFIKRKKLLKTGNAPIFIRLTIDGNSRTEFTTGKSIVPEQWITSKGRARGSNLNNKQINSYLDNLEFTIQQIILEMQQLGKQVSAKEVLKRYKGEDESNSTFLSLYSEHNEEIRTLIGNTFANATYKRHCTSKALFEEFLKSILKKPDILIKEVDVRILERYKHYLMTVRNNNNNTTVKYLRNVGKIINIAVMRGIISTNPLDSIKLKIDSVEKEFLTTTELELVASHEFEIKRLEQVRDIFLFCCYTGLAYVDVFSLTNKDFAQDSNGQIWIRKSRHKTNVMSEIPLLSPAKTILDKYELLSKVTGKALPVLSNQKMNGYLKEIAIVCGINKTLSTHTARHTFATTVTLANKVSIENVSKMLGHKNLRMTQHYAKILNESIAKEMQQLNAILTTKKENN